MRHKWKVWKYYAQNAPNIDNHAHESEIMAIFSDLGFETGNDA